MSGLGVPTSGGSGSGWVERSGVLRGRYRIVRLLGRGGMGAVYLATDALFGDRPCAVKELLGDATATPAEAAEAEERFAREARLLAALDHPHLPKVQDYFSEQGQSYLVMEFIDGETLEQRVAREGAQSQQQALAWAQEICAALEYLHAQTPPIIFRDVAPDNIMVDSAGHVKLIDFGIARVFNPSKQTDTLRFGKVGYAPPEQFSGRGQTTPRSDLFALGATLHFLLTGRDPADLPFVFPPVRESNPSVSAEVEQAILSAVQMDPARRPENARSFAEALGVCLPPLVVPAPSPALLAEVASTPARPAQQERRLVVFRQRDLNALAQRRVSRRFRLVAMLTLFTTILGAFSCILLVPSLLIGDGFSFREMFSAFGIFAPMIVWLPIIFFATRGMRARRLRNRGWIVLGRQGVLLLQSWPAARRTEMLWEDVLAVETSIQQYGPRVALRLRLKKKMSPAMQALYKFLYTSVTQMRENNTNSSLAQLQMASSSPVLTPWSASWAPWAYEQLAADQSPVPAMNLQEALLWYWQEPQRRAALADLPARGQEREIALLQEAGDSRAPVMRWIGLPVWASLAVFITSTLFTTPFHVWAYSGNYGYPGWLSYDVWHLAGLVLSSAGLAALLAFANRRGWCFKLGAAALAAAGIIQGISSFTLSFPFHLDYEFGNPYAPYSIDTATMFIWVGAISFLLMFGLSIIGERRDDARSYTGGEIRLWSFFPLIFLLMPLFQDVVLAAYPATAQDGNAALLDLALLPYLPLLILPLCYFQGRSLAVRRWTTLGVFVCGLVMTIGVLVLYLVTSGWAFIMGWPGINPLALNSYWGLNLLAGVVVMGAAARRLHVLSKEQGIFTALGADTRAVLVSATGVFQRKREPLPPGKAD